MHYEFILRAFWDDFTQIKTDDEVLLDRRKLACG